MSEYILTSMNDACLIAPKIDNNKLSYNKNISIIKSLQ